MGANYNKKFGNRRFDEIKPHVARVVPMPEISKALFFQNLVDEKMPGPTIRLDDLGWLMIEKINSTKSFKKAPVASGE